MPKELKNEFSWSKSRHGTFRECHRKYYFHYYGSWGGWNRDADRRTRGLYVLKNLESRHMWAGKRVHEAIEDILRQLRTGNELPSEAVAVQELVNRMRADFKESRARAYRTNPKKACGLFEHAYEIDVPSEEWKRVADNAELCLHNFYQSDLLSKIRQLPEKDWLEVEEFSGFDLDGLRVLVQLDFAFREGDSIFIYDWKTGRSDKDQSEIQLACYVLYATQKWGVQPEKVVATALYLADGVEKPATITPERLDTMREFIHESADEMLFPLTDPDNNIAGDEEMFEFTEDPRACKSCNFLKLCPKWSAA